MAPQDGSQEQQLEFDKDVFSQPPSSTFFSKGLSDALGEHDGKVCIEGRTITCLQFADDIDTTAEEEQELETLIDSHNKTCTKYKIEINAEKNKLNLTNSTHHIHREI